MRFAWLLSLLLCSGCGLLIDLDPPDPEGMDGGRRDAGPIVGECTDDAQCDDSDPCNGVEFCAAGECVATSPPLCSLPDACHVLDCRPGDPCHAEPIVCDASPHDCVVTECDLSTGRCEPRPVDERCVPSAACERGVCDVDQGCQFFDVCMERGVGTCEPDGNCSSTENCDPMTCNAIGEGDACLRSYCMDTTCVIEPQVGQPCTVDMCTSGHCDGLGVCLPDDTTTCFDGDPCTSDSCDPALGCNFPPVPSGTVTCDTDGDPCTREVCRAGVCQVSAPCPAPLNPCEQLVDCATCATAPVPGRTCVPAGGGCGACDAMGRCAQILCPDAATFDAGRDSGPGAAFDAGDARTACPPGTGVCSLGGSCCDRMTQYCVADLCRDRFDCSTNPCLAMAGTICCECGSTMCVALPGVCPMCTPVP